MSSLSHLLFQRTSRSGIFFDLSALAFICLVPGISHLLNVPLYLVEPMRLMLVLSLAHSDKINGYLLAVTMPLISTLISGHPVFPKMILIVAELSLNVFLFYFLVQKTKYLFPAVFLSIILSKSFYYLLKFLLIKMTVLNTDLVATPLMIQAGTIMVFGSYLFVFYRRTNHPGSSWFPG